MTRRDSLFADALRTAARIPAAVLAAIEMLILLAVLAIAWKAWSAWALVPMADNDSWGYLNPAMTWLGGLGFQQTDGRDWLYPTFLAFFLKTTGSFAGIAAWQKGLGLCSGIVMAITWRCWVSLLPFHRGVLFLMSCLGAFPIYVQLVNQQTMLFQLAIRPEAVLPLFVYAQLACLVGYGKYRWQTPRPLPSVLLGAAAIVLAYACLLLKPSWYLATATTVAPVLIGLFGQGLPLKTKLLTPALGGVVAILILWLPARAFVIRDAAAVTLLPDALFCVHVELIQKTFEARMAKLPDADPEKAKLQSLVEVMKSETYNAQHAHKVYEKLGFDADYLMHSDTFSAAIFGYAGNDRQKFKTFCYASYFDAVAHHPLAFAEKIFGQFGHFLFPEGKTFFVDQVNPAKAYKISATCWSAEGSALWPRELQEMYGRYRQDTDAQINADKTMEKHPALRGFRQVVSRVALPLEVIFLLALAACFRWAPLARLRVAGWGAFCLFLAPVGNAFGVCMVHALDIYRYRVTYGGYLLFALMAMAVFVGFVVAQSLAHLAATRRARPAE